MKIDIYKIGSKVDLTEDVQGTIVSIGIHGDNAVTYECGWWSGRSYDTKWFHPHEITVTLGEKTKIGFI
jgi:uncharacterized protein YodC (DUF2158 family)